MENANLDDRKIIKPKLMVVFVYLFIIFINVIVYFCLYEKTIDRNNIIDILTFVLFYFINTISLCIFISIKTFKNFTLQAFIIFALFINMHIYIKNISMFDIFPFLDWNGINIYFLYFYTVIFIIISSSFFDENYKRIVTALSIIIPQLIYVITIPITKNIINNIINFSISYFIFCTISFPIIFYIIKKLDLYKNKAKETS